MYVRAIAGACFRKTTCERRGQFISLLFQFSSEFHFFITRGVTASFIYYALSGLVMIFLFGLRCPSNVHTALITRGVTASFIYYAPSGLVMFFLFGLRCPSDVCAALITMGVTASFIYYALSGLYGGSPERALYICEWHIANPKHTSHHIQHYTSLKMNGIHS